MGKWNPDIELAPFDHDKEDPSDKLHLDCCVRCNNRNVIRAAKTGSKRLLQAAIKDKENISQVTGFESSDVIKTAIEYIIDSDNLQLMEALLKPEVGTIPKGKSYDELYHNLLTNRVRKPRYLLAQVETGQVSEMAYGVRIRKVQMTRGNRQGNNAFLEGYDMGTYDPRQYIQNVIQKIFENPNLSAKMMQAILTLDPYGYFANQFQQFIYVLVRSGNRKVAHMMIKKIVESPNFGFNNLHADVL